MHINLPQALTCSAAGQNPAKLYFGSTTNGTNIQAGATLESSKPIYVIYEASATDDERNPIPGRIAR